MMHGNSQGIDCGSDYGQGAGVQKLLLMALNYKVPGYKVRGSCSTLISYTYGGL